MEQMATLREMVDQAIQKKEEEKRIAEEQAARDRSWKIPVCYDDDEDNIIAITPVLPIEEPDNSLTFKEHSETIIDYNDDSTSSDDDSYENIEYVDASLPDVEIDSLEVVEIVDPEVGRIDDDILLTIKDDILREKLLNVKHLYYYKSFSYFPPADRSDFNHEEFADELTHIMSLPELECFKFKIEPDPGDLTSIDLGIRKNASTTNVNVPLEDDQSSLFTYVVWIFLAFLTYPVVPPYLLSTRNEDTIF
ncbi:hypothetical protein Tco_0598724 [Tanacetum coccineum]